MKGNPVHRSAGNRTGCPYRRAVTFGEDKSPVRTDAAPQVMAALRNTTIGLPRRAGCTNIVAALRRNAARHKEALALIGCFPTGGN